MSNETKPSDILLLPDAWNTFIPPQPISIKTEKVRDENGGGTLTRPIWNEQWLRGLDEFVRTILRDEIIVILGRKTGNTTEGEEKMTEKEAKIRCAELDKDEQDVIVEISLAREAVAALETKRERIRVQRSNVYLALMKS